MRETAQLGNGEGDLDFHFWVFYFPLRFRLVAQISQVPLTILGGCRIWLEAAWHAGKGRSFRSPCFHPFSFLPACLAPASASTSTTASAPPASLPIFS